MTMNFNKVGNIGVNFLIKKNGGPLSNQNTGYTGWENGYPNVSFTATSGDVISITSQLEGGLNGNITLSNVKFYSNEPNMVISGSI